MAQVLTSWNLFSAEIWPVFSRLSLKLAIVCCFSPVSSPAPQAYALSLSLTPLYSLKALPDLQLDPCVPWHLGNYWIRLLMGNTPWDTNNDMKVIPDSVDPAHRTRWQCQRDHCQRLCLFSFGENEYWAINIDLSGVVLNNRPRQIFATIIFPILQPLLISTLASLYRKLVFGPLWRSLENVLYLSDYMQFVNYNLMICKLSHHL